MKNFIIIFCSILVLVSCKGAYTSTSGGKEDIGFISLVGDPKKYEAGAMVSVDNGKPSIVMVVEEGKISKEDNRVKVPTGMHKITITYQNKVVYTQSALISLQETKKISLP